MLATREPVRHSVAALDMSPQIHICHVMTADLWAGAEVQLRTLASYLMRCPDVQLTAVLFNEGRLANELRALDIRVEILDEEQLTSAQIVTRLTAFLRSHRIE